MSNSHTKFGWISSSGLEGDSLTDKRTVSQKDSCLIFSMPTRQTVSNKYHSHLRLTLLTPLYANEVYSVNNLKTITRGPEGPEALT